MEPPARGGSKVSGKIEDINAELDSILKSSKGEEGVKVRQNTMEMKGALWKEKADIKESDFAKWIISA